MDDTSGAGTVYITYMEHLYKTLENEINAIGKFNEDQLNDIYRSIENYVTREIYDSIFPCIPSITDTKLHDICKGRSWIMFYSIL